MEKQDALKDQIRLEEEESIEIKPPKTNKKNYSVHNVHYREDQGEIE